MTLENYFKGSSKVESLRKAGLEYCIATVDLPSYGLHDRDWESCSTQNCIT
jgi:hypothetical protein